MSDIKVGDLVVVVRPSPCCGNVDGIGDTFIVRWVGLVEGLCPLCGDMTPANGADDAIDGKDAYDLSRLKRIPPLSELERVTEKEELHA